MVIEGHEFKAAFGEFMGRFYASLRGSTPALREYASRGLVRSVAFVKDRTIDDVESMLATWRESKIAEGITPTTACIPMILVAVERGFMITGSDFASPITDTMTVALDPEKPDESVGVQTIIYDQKAQIVIIASDHPTARNMAAQFTLFLANPDNRRFYASYADPYGNEIKMPCVLESPEVFPSLAATDQKNITILTIDSTWKESVPYFSLPDQVVYEAAISGSVKDCDVNVNPI
jgi:hypothetical protein